MTDACLKATTAQDCYDLSHGKSVKLRKYKCHWTTDDRCLRTRNVFGIRTNTRESFCQWHDGKIKCPNKNKTNIRKANWNKDKKLIVYGTNEPIDFQPVTVIDQTSSCRYKVQFTNYPNFNPLDIDIENLYDPEILETKDNKNRRRNSSSKKGKRDSSSKKDKPHNLKWNKDDQSSSELIVYNFKYDERDEERILSELKKWFRNKTRWPKYKQLFKRYIELWDSNYMKHIYKTELKIYKYDKTDNIDDYIFDLPLKLVFKKNLNSVKINNLNLKIVENHIVNENTAVETYEDGILGKNAFKNDRDYKDILWQTSLLPLVPRLLSKAGASSRKISFEGCAQTKIPLNHLNSSPIVIRTLKINKLSTRSIISQDDNNYSIYLICMGKQDNKKKYNLSDVKKKISLYVNAYLTTLYAQYNDGHDFVFHSKYDTSLNLYTKIISLNLAYNIIVDLEDLKKSAISISFECETTSDKLKIKANMKLLEDKLYRTTNMTKVMDILLKAI